MTENQEQGVDPVEVVAAWFAETRKAINDVLYPPAPTMTVSVSGPIITEVDRSNARLLVARLKVAGLLSPGLGREELVLAFEEAYVAHADVEDAKDAFHSKLRQWLASTEDASQQGLGDEARSASPGACGPSPDVVDDSVGVVRSPAVPDGQGADSSPAPEPSTKQVLAAALRGSRDKAEELAVMTFFSALASPSAAPRAAEPPLDQDVQDLPSVEAG